MQDDPFGSYGLTTIELDHKQTFDTLLDQSRPQLSDYTFANTFIWRDSIHLRWRMLHDCLCVFANGDGGLTLLFPPIGPGDTHAAVAEAVDLCRQYNLDRGLDPALVRIEYAGQNWADNPPTGYDIEPMSGDYVYLTRRMIDLDGPDLAGKRQGRNRYARRYEARTEIYCPDTHGRMCLDLLERWRQQAAPDDPQTAPSRSAALKREREVCATAEALTFADRLNLGGMVLYAGDQPVGFTLGERVDGGRTCSILIEKADREYAGSANYIFSEFCRQFWADTEYCNVGDDWDLPSLAWTKQSYRPVARLNKYLLRPPLRTALHLVTQTDRPLADRASLADLNELLGLEQACFDPAVAISRRQWRYLLRCPRASTHVIRQDGHVAAAAMLVRRKTARGTLGRLYSLAVAPAFRGRGLGRMMLDGCIDQLRSEGATGITLEVAAENAPAIKLYQSAGLACTRRLIDYYGPGRDGLRMHLPLHAGAPAEAAHVE